MLFPTAPFAIFLALVLIAHRLVPTRARASVLLAASLVFYTLWYPSYVLLLLAEIGVNFALLLAIARGRRPRLFLTASIVFTLGVLAVFKYAALGVETFLPALTPLLGPIGLPDFFLPLGISFYSFQIIALAVDVRRAVVRSVPSLHRYALFVCFFPQLIAGPILRGSEFLPQLEAGGQLERARTRRGLWLIASGLVKKTVLADFLLAPFVDSVFAEPGLASTSFHWVALYAFAFQIYFDFSGYTDMARGLACLFGFELPLNFREPYLARDPAEFWRRWHITLSRWLRDYLYIPLGGNRRGSARTALNLGVTMLLGGLWHGAAWTFVLWGGLHGLLLVVHRATGRRRDPERPLALADVPRILLLFHAVCLLWVFFRAPGFEEALAYCGALLGGGELDGWPWVPSIVVLGCAALHVAERHARENLGTLRAACDRSLWGTALEGAVGGGVLVLAVAAAGAGGAFLYFQF